MSTSADSATGERAGDPVQQPRRPHVGPEVELLADREDDAPERDVVGDGRVADGAHQAGVVGAQDVEGILGHHAAVLVPVGRAPRQLCPLQRQAQRVDDALGLHDHLGADAVPGEHGDSMGQAAAPTFPGTLSTNASASSSADDVGVLRLDVEQVRVVRRLRPVADALARHDRRESVLQQVDGRGANASARGRAAQDHRVDALRDEHGGEVGAEEPGSSLLHEHRLVLAGVEPWIDLRPGASELEDSERRHLLHPEAPVLEARLEGNRRVDDRQPLLAGGIEQPPGCLHLRAQIGAERALRVGEPAREIDHEDRGMLPERDRLPEPRLRVDLPRRLVGHVTPPPTVPAGAPRRPAPA